MSSHILTPLIYGPRNRPEIPLLPIPKSRAYINDAIKPFMAVLEKSNQEKDETAPVAIILRGTEDEQLDLPMGHWNFLEIAKTHRVFMKRIHQTAEIEKTLQEFGSQADLLVIDAHGNEESIVFSKGEEGIYAFHNMHSLDFKGLSEHATIALLSCRAGKKIASSMRRWAERDVIASEEDSSPIDMYLYKEGEKWQFSSLSGQPLLAKVFKKEGVDEDLPVTTNEAAFQRMIRDVRRSAEAGCGLNQRVLAALYELHSPERIASCIENALIGDSEVEWLKKSAEQGHPGAQMRLGEIYSDRRGWLYFPQEAAKWLVVAAQQGLTEAQKQLQLMARSHCKHAMWALYLLHEQYKEVL